MKPLTLSELWLLIDKLELQESLHPDTPVIMITLDEECPVGHADIQTIDGEKSIVIHSYQPFD